MDTTDSFTYDDFGRLSTASAGPSGTPAWNLGFAYDRYGNRTAQNILAGTAYSMSTPTDPDTNRISGYSYDNAGNLLNDGFAAYSYDAENRVRTVDQSSN